MEVVRFVEARLPVFNSCERLHTFKSLDLLTKQQSVFKRLTTEENLTRTAPICWETP
jgi:hypothetical protein